MEGIDEELPENSVYKISPSLEIILLLFFFSPPWMLLAHPLVLLRGAFSRDVCANPFFKRRQTSFITKVGARITYRKPNVLCRGLLFRWAWGHIALISSLVLCLFTFSHFTSRQVAITYFAFCCNSNNLLHHQVTDDLSKMQKHWKFIHSIRAHGCLCFTAFTWIYVTYPSGVKRRQNLWL